MGCGSLDIFADALLWNISGASRERLWLGRASPGNSFTLLIFSVGFMGLCDHRTAHYYTVVGASVNSSNFLCVDVAKDVDQCGFCSGDVLSGRKWSAGHLFVVVWRGL